MYDIVTLNTLQDKVKRKLSLVRRGGYMSKREEGYEEALLQVLSMIHELKRYELSLEE